LRDERVEESLGVLMITRALGWGLATILLASVAWWHLDPVGFSKNPVVSYFRNLSLRSSGYYR